MGSVSLTNYDSQIAELDRRQKLADALAQQSQAPIQLQSYNGIKAMPSKWEALSKILAGITSAKSGKDITAERGQLDTQARDQAAQALQSFYNPTAAQPAPPAPQPGAFDRATMTPQAPQGPIGASGPQAMAQALGGPQQAPSAPQQPVPNQMQSAAGYMTSTNPYLRQMAPTLYQTAQTAQQHATDRQDAAAIHAQDRQDQIDQHKQEIADASAQKITDKESDIKTAQGQVQAIRAQLKDPSQQAVLAAAALNGTAAVQPLLTQMAANGFKDKFRPATPEELQGYPHGTTGQVNATTGELAHVYNPTADANSTAQVRIAQQNANTNAARAADSVGGGAQALTPQESAALVDAMHRGMVDPNHVNGRNQKILAQSFLAHPELNMVNAHGFAQVVASVPTQMKVEMAQQLPTILQGVADAGKAVNFSGLKAIGGFQKFVKEQTNDPKLAYYMTRRNDAIMGIAAVMRGTGMSDKATQLEEQAAHPTMDPKATDAWLRAQLDSLQPRLNALGNFALTNPTSGAPVVTPPAPTAAPASGWRVTGVR